MTPKEKAEDLFYDMFSVEDPMGNHYVCEEIAKQCALIAVDEIIKCAIWKYNAIEHTIYWKEVKHEIEIYER